MARITGAGPPGGQARGVPEIGSAGAAEKETKICMNISKKTEGTTLTIALEGRLDTTTSPQLEGALHPDIDGAEELIFDLAQLQYISSAGLRVLLSAQKIMNKQGQMTIRNVCPEIMDIFDVTGFVDILNIEE